MSRSDSIAELSDEKLIEGLIALPKSEVFSLLEATIDRPQQVFDREFSRRMEFVRRGGRRRVPRVGNLTTGWMDLSAYYNLARRIICPDDNKKLVARYLTATNVTAVASLLPSRFGIGPDMTTEVPSHFVFAFAVLVLQLGINDFCRSIDSSKSSVLGHAKPVTKKKSRRKKQADLKLTVAPEQQVLPLKFGNEQD